MNPQNEPKHEALTVKDAAMELGISPSLAYEFVRQGHLTAYRYSERKTVVYREDLEAFKQSRRVEPPNTKEAG